MKKVVYSLLSAIICLSLSACDPYELLFGEVEIGDGPYYEPIVYIDNNEGQTRYKIDNDTVYSYWGDNALYSIEDSKYGCKVYTIPQHTEVCSVDNDIIYIGQSRAYRIEGDSIFEFSYSERKFSYLIR